MAVIKIFAFCGSRLPPTVIRSLIPLPTVVAVFMA